MKGLAPAKRRVSSPVKRRILHLMLDGEERTPRDVWVGGGFECADTVVHRACWSLRDAGLLRWGIAGCFKITPAGRAAVGAVEEAMA